MIIVLLGPCRCHCPANKFLAAACLLSSGLNPFAPPCSLCCFGQWLLVEWVALVHGSCYCIVSSAVPHVDASTAWFGWGRIIYVSIYNCWKNSFPANAILICQVLSTAEGINRKGFNCFVTQHLLELSSHNLLALC